MSTSPSADALLSAAHWLELYDSGERDQMKRDCQEVAMWLRHHVDKRAKRWKLGLAK